MAPSRHKERHRTDRIGWLRASVLGANDGIVSTSSLVLGVAGSGAAVREVLVAGVAGLVAGAMSMAAGEYISVSSQADTEKADLAFEAKELAAHPEGEREELAGIYRQRGLKPALAMQVAEALMEKDALGAHARDELGITETTAARPVQAAVASAFTFSVGAGIPLLSAWLAPASQLVPVVGVVCLLCLGALGALAARAGGAPWLKGTLRVTLWSAVAMALTFAVGKAFGTSAA